MSRKNFEFAVELTLSHFIEWGFPLYLTELKDPSLAAQIKHVVEHKFPLIKFIFNVFATLGHFLPIRK